MFKYITVFKLYLYNSTFMVLSTSIAAAEISKHTEIIAIPLILALCLKMILQESKLWNRSLATFLNITIYSLLLIYGVVVFFKIESMVVQSYSS